MGRLTKFLLIAVAALALLFAVAAIYFLLFFDPNDVRTDIEQVVEETTGRELTIGGEVGLQVIPWLAISVSDVTLGNAPSLSHTKTPDNEKSGGHHSFSEVFVKRRNRITVHSMNQG